MTQRYLPRSVLSGLLTQYCSELNDLSKVVYDELSFLRQRPTDQQIVDHQSELVSFDITFPDSIVQSDEYKTNLVYQEDENNPGCIYLIHIREFLTTGQNVYKIGRTQQKDLKRFKTYPNGSELLFHAKCNDCVSAEKYLIKLFSKYFLRRQDLGNEYFQGELSDMLRQLHKYMMETTPVKPGYSESSSSSSSYQSSLSSTKKSPTKKSSIKKNAAGEGYSKEMLETLLNIDNEIPKEPTYIPPMIRNLRPVGRRPLESHVVVIVKDVEIKNLQDSVPNPKSILDICQRGDESQLVTLLNHCKKSNVNLDLQEGLRVAIEYNNARFVDLLRQAGGKLNVQDENGDTFLYTACCNGLNDEVKLLLRYPEVIRSINQVDSDGCYPLFFACFGGNLKIVRLLLQYPEGKSSLTCNSDELLQTACGEGYVEMVKFLLLYLGLYQASFKMDDAILAAKGQPNILALLKNY